MPRVSLRTLILLLELLVAVVALQYLTVAGPIQANTIWLAADCHTASTMRVHMAAPVAAAPAPGTPGENAREP
jgi:hypothetical protein